MVRPVGKHKSAKFVLVLVVLLGFVLFYNFFWASSPYLASVPSRPNAGLIFPINAVANSSLEVFPHLSQSRILSLLPAVWLLGRCGVSPRLRWLRSLAQPVLLFLLGSVLFPAPITFLGFGDYSNLVFLNESMSAFPLLHNHLY